MNTSSLSNKDIEQWAAFVESGKPEEEYGNLLVQRALLIEACEAFIKYDSNDHSDGVSMMIDYNEALRLCKSALASIK